MNAENDLMKLYSGQILALASDIPHIGRLEDPDGSAKKRSPLCGSTVTVDINMSEGRISDYAQDIKACALGQAAASVVGAVAIGLDQSDVQKARDQLEAMLKSNGPVPDKPFEGLGVLLPAKDFKNRHASILLTLDALVDAIGKSKAA